MSKRTELKADLERIGYALGGAHLTRQARGATFSTFAKTMGELGLEIRSAKQIGARHLKAFVTHKTAQGISPRTLANELSHLRAVLWHIGKQGFLSSVDSTNQALGVGRGSRVGTKPPLSDATLAAFRESMAQIGRPGIGETSQDLGHGDGRGRYIASVYARDT